VTNALYIDYTIEYTYTFLRVKPGRKAPVDNYVDMCKRKEYNNTKERSNLSIKF